MTDLSRLSSRVAALAGRRIDAPNAKDVQFPLDHVRDVERQLRRRFVDDSIGILVCSAACGADLVALQIATGMGIDRTIVLPFEARRFLQTSVLDRPGNWKDLYKQQIEEARLKHQLIVLEGQEDNAGAYSAATGRIIAEAIRKTGSARGVAYAVWEGQARSNHDETADFRRDCKAAGFEIRDINTLSA